MNAVNAVAEVSTDSALRVRAIVTTTHQVEAYGGFQFTRDAMQQIADGIQSGRMPMHFDHDLTRPVGGKNLVAGIQEMDDGHLAVWVEFDAPVDAWTEYEARRQEAGAPGGFSISITSPIDTSRAHGRHAIAADASHFATADISAAAGMLERLGGGVQAEHLFQFSYVPEPRIVIDLAWAAVRALAPNVVASAIYDAGRLLLRRRKSDGPISFDLVIRNEANGSRMLQVSVKTESESTFRDAMNALPALLQSAEPDQAATYRYSGSIKAFGEVDAPNQDGWATPR